MEDEEEEKEVILPPPKKQLLEVEDEGADDPEEENEAEDEYLFKPDTKNKSKIIDVEFELVLPSEAYYHSVRALMG